MPRPAKQAICHPSRKHQALGFCLPCYRKFYQLSPVGKRKRKEARVRSRRRDVERTSKHYLRTKYGITREQYLQLIKEQNNICALCERPLDLKGYGGPVLDHCHITGKKREIVHQRCNSAIGFLEDDPKLVRKALLYLDKHNMINYDELARQLDGNTAPPEGCNPGRDQDRNRQDERIAANPLAAYGQSSGRAPEPQSDNEGY